MHAVCCADGLRGWGCSPCVCHILSVESLATLMKLLVQPGVLLCSLAKIVMVRIIQVPFLFGVVTTKVLDHVLRSL